MNISKSLNQLHYALIMGKSFDLQILKLVWEQLFNVILHCSIYNGPAYMHVHLTTIHATFQCHKPDNFKLVHNFTNFNFI